MAAGITAPRVSIGNPSRRGTALRPHTRARSHAPRTHLGHSGSRRAGPARGRAGRERREPGRLCTAGGDPRPRSRAGTPGNGAAIAPARRERAERHRTDAAGQHGGRESRVCGLFLSKVLLRRETAVLPRHSCVRPSSTRCRAVRATRPPPRDEGRGALRAAHGAPAARARCPLLPATRAATQRAVPGARGTPRRCRGHRSRSGGVMGGRLRTPEGEQSGPVPEQQRQKRKRQCCEPPRAWQRLQLHSATWKNRRLCKTSRTAPR